MQLPESYYRAVLGVAQKEPTIMGFILERSQGKGVATQYADRFTDWPGKDRWVMNYQVKK